MCPRSPTPRRQGRHPGSAGRRLLLGRGAGLEGVARAPAGFSHPFPTDAGPGLPDLPSKRSERCEHVEADPGNGPGPICGGLDPLHFRILERRLRVLQKIRPVFRPEKPRRAVPVARGQQTPVRRGPRSQHPTGRRIGLGGAALGPETAAIPTPNAKAMLHTLTKRFIDVSCSTAPASGKKTTGKGRMAPSLHWIRARTERISSF